MRQKSILRIAEKNCRGRHSDEAGALVLRRAARRLADIAAVALLTHLIDELYPEPAHWRIK